MNFKQFLTEGMIKLPQQLLKKLQDEVTGVALSMIQDSFADQLGASELTSAEKKLAQEFFGDWMKAYEGIPVKKLQVKISKKIPMGDVKLDDVPERYRKLLDRPPADDYWTLEGTPLSLKLFMKPFKDQSFGAYNSQHNMVKISLSRFKLINFKVFFRVVQRASEAGAESKKQFFAKNAKEVLDRLSDMIDRIRGDVEHEVAHYVQYKILSRGHEKQVDHRGKTVSANKKLGAEESYYSSSVEFDPQIKTAVSDFKTIKRRLLASSPDADIKALALWMTASAPRDTVLKNVKHDVLVPDDQFEFFKQIKKLDQEKWKKAVKLFMKEVN